MKVCGCGAETEVELCSKYGAENSCLEHCNLYSTLEELGLDSNTWDSMYLYDLLIHPRSLQVYGMGTQFKN